HIRRRGSSEFSQHPTRHRRGRAERGAFGLHLSFHARAYPRVRPWHQTSTFCCSAVNESAGCARRRRFSDRTRRKSIDCEKRLARKTCPGNRSWVENYVALGVKKQPPMLVADYRRQNKSPPVE